MKIANKYFGSVNDSSKLACVWTTVANPNLVQGEFQSNFIARKDSYLSLEEPFVFLSASLKS
jgi:hypothetical protein